MSEDWDDYAGSWDSNEAVIAYSEMAYESLTKMVNIKGIRVLDFGCGTGLLTEKIACEADSVVALDSSAKMTSVLESKRLNNVATLALELSEESIEANSPLKAKFDLIVASSVCAFLPDYAGALKLLKRLLKPNGIFVQWDWLETEENSAFGFTEQEIQSALIGVGLEILKVKRLFH